MSRFSISKYSRLKPKWPLTLLLALILLGAGGWFVHEKTRTLTYRIPPGTSQQLRAGMSVAVLPKELTFTIGIQDTLVIENQDEVSHTLGPFDILAHSRLTQRFTTPLLYDGQSSLHENHQIRIVVKPAPWWYIFPSGDQTTPQKSWREVKPTP